MLAAPILLLVSPVMDGLSTYDHVYKVLEGIILPNALGVKVYAVPLQMDWLTAAITGAGLTVTTT